MKRSLPPIIKKEVEEIIHERPRKRPFRLPRSVEVKVEDKPNGLIKCPKCSTGIVSNRGCNMMTCKNHKPKWFYFCFHCKKESLSAIPCGTCPSDIGEQAQITVLCQTMNVIRDGKMLVI